MDPLNLRSAFPGKMKNGREIPARTQAGTQRFGSASMSRRRAIQKALGRLGMQASNREVVVSLEGFGIDETEAQVRQVKVEMLKEAAKVEWQKVTVPGRRK